MRRIRSQDPGAFVLFDPTPRRSTTAGGWGVRIESNVQIALDTDVRKLVDRIRLRLGDAMRGRSTPQLERTWHLLPISGGPAFASSQIELTSNGGSAYLGRVFDPISSGLIPKITAEWLTVAAPASGDGVGTETTATTSGGPLPPNPTR